MARVNLTDPLIFLWLMTLTNTVLLLSMVYIDNRVETGPLHLPTIDLNKLLDATLPLALNCLLMYFFVNARTYETVFSPKELFNMEIFVTVFLATAYSTYIGAFKKNFHNLLRLTVIAVFMIATGSFMILSYGYMFSTDIWEYLAVEKLLTDGGTLHPRSNLYNLLLDGNNLYLGVYSLNILLSWMTSVDLYWVTLSSVYLLFNISLPFLFFEVSRQMGYDGKAGLLATMLSNTIYWAFIFRTLSTANMLGIGFLLYSTLMWIIYLKGNTPLLIPLLATFGNVFSYPPVGAFSILIAATALTINFLCSNRLKIQKALVVFLFADLSVLILSSMHLAAGGAPVNPVQALIDLFFPSELDPKLSKLFDISFSLTLYSAWISIIFKSSKQHPKIRFLTVISFTIILVAAVYSDIIGVTTKRIHTTIIPYFTLVMIIPLLDSMIREFAQSHVVSKTFIEKPKVSLLKDWTRRSVGVPIFLFLVSLATLTSYVFMPYLGPNISKGNYSALEYVANNFPRNSTLVLADPLSCSVLNAMTAGTWYGSPTGIARRFFSSTIIYHRILLFSPSSSILKEAMQEVEKSFKEVLLSLLM